MHFQNRDELCKYVSQLDNRETVLSFSRGKDSIGSYLQLRKHFDIIHLFHYHLIPDLEFIETSLQYYEKIFNTHIIRVPNPHLYRMLNDLIFQPPTNIFNIFNMQLPKYNVNDLELVVKKDIPVNDKMFVANGVRKSDSLMRMTFFAKHGCLSEKHHKYYPIWDITAKDLYQSFRDNNIKLPIDYKFWGRTFDGIDYKYINIIYKEFPNDYKRIQDFFPLLDMERLRYDNS